MSTQMKIVEPILEKNVNDPEPIDLTVEKSKTDVDERYPIAVDEPPESFNSFVDDLLEQSFKERKHEKIIFDLEKKKTELPYKVGILAFSFNKNPLMGVDGFTLATFQDVILNEKCKKNWVEKLRYYVQSLKITHLYVQGYEQFQFLKKELDVYISRMPKRVSWLCPKCRKSSCSVYKVKTFFASKYKYNLPINCS